MKHLTQAVVQEVLDYNEHTGLLYWRERPEFFFATRRAWLSWNTKFAGKQAFTAIQEGCQTDYYRGGLFGKIYLAHRIIFIHVAGIMPAQVDHINGNGLDNRWCNLRAAINATIKQE